MTLFDQSNLAEKYYTFWTANIIIISLLGLLVVLLLCLIHVDLKDIKKQNATKVGMYDK